MVNENLFEVVLIVDRSDSMSDLKYTTISLINEFIESQKQEKGETNVTITLFDSKITNLFTSKPLYEVEKITDKEYNTGGFTALYDAIGITINKLGDKLSKMEENNRPKRVIIGILTDGAENRSVEFKQLDKIKNMIKHQTEKYNWNFIFMSSHISCWNTSSALGISKNNTITYKNNPLSLRNNIMSELKQLFSSSRDY